MIELIPSRPEDKPFLFKVYANSREEELSIVQWSPEEKEAFLRSQFEAQDAYYRLQIPTTRFDLIVENDVPIGRLYMFRCESHHTVVDIALLAKHRGRGIGSYLLDQILREAEAAGKPVRLHVEHYNRARRLYQRLGFRQIGDHGVYYELEWRPGDVELPRTRV